MPAPDPLEQLLKEVKEDPTGWAPLDMLKMLDLAGFERRSVQDAQGWPVDYRYHPENPDLNVIIYPTDRVHMAVALRVVWIIEKLRSRASRSVPHRRSHGSESA